MSTARGPRVAVVTGAGAGIGWSVARRLAHGGHHVIATVRDPTRATRLTEEAAASHLRLDYIPLELTDPKSIEAAACAVHAAGGADLLVHNAGFGVFGAVEDVADVERQFAVHVFGPLALTRRLLPGLRARRGRVIWIGSLAGRMALPFQAHYSATKAAIASISDAMRIELEPHGVRVSCVEPSDFATGFTSSRTVVRAEGSAYQQAADRCLHEVERQERAAPDPEWVSKVVERLARHPSPPARVPVGRHARLICILLQVLPRRLTERMIRSHYGV